MITKIGNISVSNKKMQLLVTHNVQFTGHLKLSRYFVLKPYSFHHNEGDIEIDENSQCNANKMNV